MDDWRVLELKFVFLCGKRIERVYNVEEHISKLRIFVLLVSCSIIIREQTKKGKTFLSNIFSTARASLERIIVIGRSSSIPSEILILIYQQYV